MRSPNQERVQLLTAQHWSSLNSGGHGLAGIPAGLGGLQLEQDKGIQGKASPHDCASFKHKRFEHEVALYQRPSDLENNSTLAALFLHFITERLVLFPPPTLGLAESALSAINCHRPFKCVFAKSSPSESFSLDFSLNPQ